MSRLLHLFTILCLLFIIIVVVVIIVIIIIIIAVIKLLCSNHALVSNYQVASDVIGISLKYDDNEDSTTSNNLSGNITITFNHTTSLAVS